MVERRLERGRSNNKVQNIEKGNPIGFIYPTDGTLLCFGPGAVMAAAPHPNAARLFLEWLLSEDYAQACVKWHLEPVRADAPQMQGTKRLSEIKLLKADPAEVQVQSEAIKARYAKIFGV